MTGRWFSIRCAVSTVVLGAWLSGCKSAPGGASERRWFRCACSYVSDFDEPGAAPVDVCAEGGNTSDIAAACTRNAGVGVPTACRCETEPRGPCDRNDRCRVVDEPRQ